MCNGFLSEIRDKYSDVDGLVSVSIKYPDRWGYSGDVSSFGSANISTLLIAFHKTNSFTDNPIISFQSE